MAELNWDQIYRPAAGAKQSARHKSLAELAIVILVGLAGVGKTTTLELLAKSGVNFTLLPNRRKITDEIIITAMQQAAGETVQPVTDRLTRFEYTARYRAKYAGGMAHALSQLAVDPSQLTFPVIFDGLRGLDEVRQATRYFPHCRFIGLDAPDTVRLSRLLHRGDIFDTTAGLPAARNDLLATLLNVPHISTVFNQEQLVQITRSAHQSQLLPEEIIQKTSIIVKERHNYDSTAAWTFLADKLPAERVLLLDTHTHPPAAVAEQIAEWL